MTQLILKWIVVLAALFAAGPLAASLVAPLHLADGSHAASLFTDGSFTQGLFAGLGVLALATVIGVVSGNLVARDMGLTVAGLVIAWAAWRFSSVDRAASRIGSGGMLATLAIEGLLMGLAGTAIAAAIGLTSREKLSRSALFASFPDDQPQEKLPRQGLVTAGLVGVAAAAGVVWIIAVEPTRGQCVMAAVTGGIACGGAAQLSASMRRLRLGPIVPMLSMTLLATLSPLITMQIHGSSLVETAMAGKLFPLGKLGPMDWLAGALLGVPIGLAWANSMLEKEPASAAA